MTLPFDPDEFARNIVLHGRTAVLNECLRVFVEQREVVAKCSRCDCEKRVPLGPNTLVFSHDFSDFMLKHTHGELAS